MSTDLSVWSTQTENNDCKNAKQRCLYNLSVWSTQTGDNLVQHM